MKSEEEEVSKEEPLEEEALPQSFSGDGAEGVGLVLGWKDAVGPAHRPRGR